MVTAKQNSSMDSYELKWNDGTAVLYHYYYDALVSSCFKGKKLQVIIIWFSTYTGVSDMCISV